MRSSVSPHVCYGDIEKIGGVKVPGGQLLFPYSLFATLPRGPVSSANSYGTSPGNLNYPNVGAPARLDSGMVLWPKLMVTWQGPKFNHCLITIAHPILVIYSDNFIGCFWDSLPQFVFMPSVSFASIIHFALVPFVLMFLLPMFIFAFSSLPDLPID